MAKQALPCWCGHSGSTRVTPDYVRCERCFTVRYAQPIERSLYGRVGDDETGFYGAGYWRERVPEVLAGPTLEERASADLNERAPFYLRRILDYLEPRGSLLEIGCAPGALLYLAAAAGFEAQGLEMSPSVVAWIGKHFGVAVRRGPLENLEPSKPHRAAVAIDLIEHLPDPLATLRELRRRMTSDARLFLQTPCYRSEKPDWEMFLPEEHLYLFDQASVQQLLERAGFAACLVEPSLFPYDMWVTAAVQGAPNRPRVRDELSPWLSAHLELVSEHRRLQAERLEVDRDRAERLRQIERLSTEVEALRTDQADKDRELLALTAELGDVRCDQAAKDALLRRVDAELQELRDDQQAKERLLESLAARLGEAEGDQRGKEALIAQLDRDLEATRNDQRRKEALIERLEAELQKVREDQSSKERLIVQLDAELAALRRDQSEKQELIERLEAESLARRQDQQLKESLIVRISQELEEVRADQAAKERVITELSRRVHSN